MTAWTPKLTNVSGKDGTTSVGEYVDAGGVVTFTGMIVVDRETNAASSAGFGLTLPVPAKKTGARTTFQISLDGRDADTGVWTGEGLIFAGSDGKTIDRLRVTGTQPGAAMPNIGHFYGGGTGTNGEVLTVSGSYIRA